jgi:hypothetical protein
VKPNVFAYTMLLLYPLIAVGVFRSLRPAVAAVLLVVCGDLFLPQDTSFDLTGLPVLAKDQFIYLSVVVGALASVPGRLASTRPGFYEAMAIVLAAGGAITTLTNQDPIRYGPTVLPAMPWGDFPSGAISDLLWYLLPFWLGRALVRQGRDVRVIIATLAGGGMVYSLLCWVEIQLSPQLHVWVYGFMPSAFVMAYRWGGFRPIVFMENGLATSIFMAMALISCAALARVRAPVLRLPARPATGWLTVTIVACKSVASAVFGIVLGGAVLVLKPRMLARIAVLLCLLLSLYPALRLAKLFPVDTIGELAYSFDETRGKSLTGRFEVERKMLDLARERPWFGWGGYSRNWPYDPETGESLVVPDGYWILQLGSRGVLGFVCAFGMLVIPVLGAAMRIGKVRDQRDQILLAALLLVIAVRVVDQIPNGRWSSLPVFLAGALYSTSRALVAEHARARRREAAAGLARPSAAASGPGPGGEPDPPAKRGPRLADLLRSATREPGP